MKLVPILVAMMALAACGSSKSASTPKTVTVPDAVGGSITTTESGGGGSCSQAIESEVTGLFGQTAKPTVDLAMGPTPGLVTKKTIAKDKATIQRVITQAKVDLKPCTGSAFALNAQKSIKSLKSYL